MSSITTVPPAEEDKKPRAFSPPPNEEQRDYPATTYDPAPASWFFNRGSKDSRNISGTEIQNPSENSTKGKEDEDDSSSPPPSNDIPSSGTNHHPSSTNQSNSNPDWGMVSDNDEEDDDFEGFNFIAVSKSLLMTNPSFDHASENQNDSPKFDSEMNASGASGDRNQGVLIVDGTETNSEDSALSASPNNHNPDASILTVPGSDSLPSDIGSISSGDGILEQDNQNEHDGVDEEESSKKNHPPLIHRFFHSLRQQRRLRLVSDASDENHGDNASGVSIVRDDDEFSMAWTLNNIEDHFCGIPRRIFWRRRTLVVFLGLLFATGLFSHHLVASLRRQRQAYERRLQEEKEEMERLLAEHKSLRNEMEILVEEVAVATARADSLAREQARLLIERQEAEKAEKEWEERQRRKEQPWRNGFFGDADEECYGHRDDGSTTFTIADNCWIKAKADINLGSCGSETKDFFADVLYGDMWKNFFGDWDFYFNYPTRDDDALVRYSTSTRDGGLNNEFQTIGHNNDYKQIPGRNDEENRERDYTDQGRQYEYEDDTYYPPQDPLQDLFSVMQSAGQSFVDKLTNLVYDEVKSSQTIAREMEETVSQRFLSASQTISDAMELAKEDMGDLSKEVLSVLRTAVQQNEIGKNGQSSRSSRGQKEGTNTSPPTNEVTRKGLFDAASVLSMLSKSVAGEKSEN